MKLNNWNQDIPFVLNFHITKACNMKCVFCFGGFKETKKQKTKEEWIWLIKKIGNETKSLPDRRINFAGGEPLLIPYLPELIKVAKEEGFKTSIITNGALLTEVFLDKIEKHIDMIGISIDSVSDEINDVSGRRTIKGVMSVDDYIERCQWISNRGIKLKVNTVIHNYNAKQDMSKLLENTQIDRWKILRMLKIENENALYNHLYPSSEDFNHFIKRHEKYNPIVEDNEDMASAYLFISPNGELMDNSNERMIASSSLFETSFEEAFENLPFNYEHFSKRYK